MFLQPIYRRDFGNDIEYCDQNYKNDFPWRTAPAALAAGLPTDDANTIAGCLLVAIYFLTK